ncbi:hypothetical protein [Streptomyces sp. WG7]|uniref:hypothetical protein n=1 Tax=Streptomyces sp. WG7 TaxID=3417650 RepID=UPI003CF0EBFF
MTGPAEPPDGPASGPGDRESPRSHPSSQIIILTICTSVLLLLLMGGFALYLVWQHPSLTGPMTAAAAAITVPLTVVGIILALMKR